MNSEKLKTALIIGSSDGIGAMMVKKLLEHDYRVVGISKSPSEIQHPHYQHFICDVSSPEYRQTLIITLSNILILDLCIYCAGIGDEFKWNNLAYETKVFEVNLMAAVITTEIALNKMIGQDGGHFIGLSSIADCLISPESPSYSASKSGVSYYWEGLGLANKNKKIKISNIRFGFVDTKMAKSPVRPFLLTVDEATNFIFQIMKKPKIRATKPKEMIPLVWLLGLVNRLKLLFQ